MKQKTNSAPEGATEAAAPVAVVDIPPPPGGGSWRWTGNKWESTDPQPESETTSTTGE